MFAPVRFSAEKNIGRDHSASAAFDAIQLRKAPARAKVHSVA
jgi:hypothetical protein